MIYSSLVRTESNSVVRGVIGIKQYAGVLFSATKFHIRGNMLPSCVIDTLLALSIVYIIGGKNQWVLLK